MSDFIERARAFDRDATEGPWEVGEEEQWDLDGDRVPQKPVMSRGRPLTWDDHGGEVFEPYDAEFIAAARTMLPAAVEALARVRELHAPKNVYPMKDGTWIRHCRGCQTVATFTEWPCATYKATEVEA